jgi:hypothetical protein
MTSRRSEPHALIVVPCDRCGGPMCKVCQRPVDRVYRAYADAVPYWRHARRIGCR